MKLLRLHIENFGTLQDFSLSPADGLNVLYQKNGWGKSTLAVFIKAMLYGLPATSRRSLDENERKKYTPWQGGAYGGSLEFETAKGRFRVERFFGAKEAADTFALFDLATNKPSEVYTEQLGVELFGIDADGFERTTYLSQRNLTGSRENAGITAKLGSLLDDVGDIGNYEAAMAALDKRRSYYIKTGNRGAIADLEQEIVTLQKELEECLRIEEVRKEKQAALEGTSHTLGEQNGALERLRTEMQAAGLGRERVAHNEERGRMQDELRRLTVARDRINDFFRNAPPSRSELDEGCRLYDEIKAAKTRLDAVPSAIADADALQALRRRYPKGAPDAKLMERIEADNNELIHLHARLRVLSEGGAEGEDLARFPKGAPNRNTLNEADEALRQARALQDSARHAQSGEGIVKPSGTKKAVGASLSAAGILLAVLSFLPVMQAFLLPLLIGGGMLLTVGIVLFCLSASENKRYRRKRAEQERVGQQQAEKARAMTLAVRKMLSEYGLSPANDAELSHHLAQLAALSERYWNSIKQERHRKELLSGVSARIDELSARLHACFSAFQKDLPRKTDYRAELETLKTEIARLSYLEAAERARLSDLAQAKRELNARQEALLPFLRRFDRAGKMLAGECINYVSEQSAEFARLEKEIAARRAALSSFIVEKRLDENEKLPDREEYSRLVAREKELLRTVDELQSRQTQLRGEIDRLGVDTDRLPELSDALAQCKQTMAEAKANAVTIAHTAKFLQEAKTALSTRYLGGMQESFTRALSRLVPGQAPQAVMDTSFEVRLREGGQSRTMESFSRGWRDTVEFCTRLSLTEALYAEGEKPFLLLDDPFVNLDDERLASVRNLLESLAEEYQILYLVCHKDRI